LYVFKHLSPRAALPVVWKQCGIKLYCTDVWARESHTAVMIWNVNLLPHECVSPLHELRSLSNCFGGGECCTRKIRELVSAYSVDCWRTDEPGAVKLFVLQVFAWLIQFCWFDFLYGAIYVYVCMYVCVCVCVCVYIYIYIYIYIVKKSQ